MTTDDLAWAGVAELAERIAKREVSAVEAVDSALTRIEQRNPALNAMSVVLADRAREEAARRDAATAAGEPTGPLHGVPVVVKEEVDVEGCVTTFGGRANHTPAVADGEVVRRLRAAGAVIVGKTLMPEFGQWPFTESRAFGVTRNPWRPTHTPGGSSGGTAVAVASGMVPAGLGGDGGGSIRLPSAATGLFGLKPQRGRVSTAPAPHLWCSLGVLGPLTRSVLDSALVYDAIRGSIATDQHRADEPRMSFVDAATSEPGRLRIGWSTKPVLRGVKVDHQHVAAVEQTARLLADLGHDVEECDPRYPDPTLAFLPQFFGGVRAEAAVVENRRRLEPHTKHVLRLGVWARPRVVRAAERAGERVAAKVNRVFENYEVLLTPVTPGRPRETGVLDTHFPAVMQRSTAEVAFVAIWNVAGNPAASVPAGLAEDGLPLAVQLVGRPNDEPTLLQVAAQLERARPWAHLRPPVA